VISILIRLPPPIFNLRLYGTQSLTPAARKKFAVERYLDPIALRVRHSIDANSKSLALIMPVAEFPFDKRLERGAENLGDSVEAINQ
jgi:hypothetical protein